MKDTPSRSTYRATLAISVVLGLGILVLVNYIGSRRYARFDWTTTGRYSLSEKTVNVLKDLKTPVQVTVFMTAGTPLYPGGRRAPQALQGEERRCSPSRRSTRRATRSRAKTFVEETGVRNLAVVFRAGDKKKIVTEDRIVEYDYSRARMGGEPSVKSFRGEQEFTSAILSCHAGEGPEGPLHVRARRAQVRRGPEPRGILGGRRVAQGRQLHRRGVGDARRGRRAGGRRSRRRRGAAHALHGARARRAEEVPRRRRPRVLFFLDVEFPPGAPSTLSDFGLGPLLTSLGLTLDSDVVVDPKNTLPMMGAETVFAKSFRSHPVTKLLAGMPVVFPLARSVSVAQTPVPGWKATPLVETSPDGWGETNLKDLEKTGLPKKDDKDVKGPVCLAAAVEADDGSKAAPGDGTKPGEAPKKKARVVVFGDADWASNAGIANAANRLLLSSAVNWALERESLVAIPPKSADQVAVTLTRRDIGQVAFVVLLLLPLAAVAMGVAIWVRRRK